MEDEQPDKQYEIREGIVFLIELTPSLKSHLVDILKSIGDLISQLIISCPHNGVGIYFYNCAKTNRKLGKQSGLNKLFRLNDINVSAMKVLNAIIDDTIDDFENFTSQFPIDDNPRLDLVLQAILGEFQRGKQYNVKKLVWITDNDCPKVENKESTRSFLSDYDQFKYQIIPIFMDTSKEFNIDVYKDLFLQTGYINNLIRISLVKKEFSNQIRDSILRLKEIKRIQFACNLILSDGEMGGRFGCSIKGYTLYDHETITRSRNMYISESGPKIVKTSTKYSSGDLQDDQIDSAKIRRGYELNNNTIIHFDEEQLKFMKNYAFHHGGTEEIEDSLGGVESDDHPYTKTPYLKLVGFRRMGNFENYFNCKNSIFVSADIQNGRTTSSLDYGYTNSFTTFASLYQSCLKLNKYMIVFGCIKRNSSPYLYSLVPNHQPQGFLLIKKPWLNEIRCLPEYVMTEEYLKKQNDESLSEKFIKIINQYYLSSFKPSDWPNPTLNYWYKILKYELLQNSISPQDKLLQNNDDMLKKRNFLNNDIQNVKEFNFIKSQLNKIGNTYTVKQNNAMPPNKKPRLELTEDVVLTAWNKNEWNYFTVAQLKEFINKYPNQIKKGSTKQELIDNISDFLSKRT